MFNETQTKVINHTTGNLAVIAAAGSGKTTVITHRIVNLINSGVNPQSILAITFNKDNKETLYSRLQNLIPDAVDFINIETFHSFALKIIQNFYHGIYSVWMAKYEKNEFIKNTLISMGLVGKYEEEIPYNEIYDYFAFRKLNKPRQYKSPYKEWQMGKIYDTYEKHKEQNYLIEFDDFLPMANDILENNPDVLEYYRNKIQYILADEFQDVSAEQAELLYKINKYNTMIVGDPLQAIYSFRGGNSKYILDFGKDYENTTVENLNINYRCSKPIVALANNFAECINDSKHEYYKPQEAVNNTATLPSLTEYIDQFDEAYKIAEDIKNKINEGKKYSDIMILARTNAQLQVIQQIFSKQKIPFEVTKGDSMTDQPELKLLLSYLRLAYNTNDDDSFEYIYNKPNRFLGKQFMDKLNSNARRYKLHLYNALDKTREEWKFKKGIDEIIDVIETLRRNKKWNPGEQAKYVRERLDVDSYFNKGDLSDEGSFGDKSENMDTAIKMWGQYKTTEELLKDIDSTNASFGNNKVKILTIHRAKGMESDIIYLIGCNEGYLPHYRNMESEDEKHIMYVAITRAKNELNISYVDDAINQHVYGISSYISNIPDNILHKVESED